MEDFFNNIFGGFFQGFTDYSGLGADTSGASSIGGDAATAAGFQKIFSTAPDYGASWMSKGYEVKEPHPMDDWVTASFQNIANERLMQKQMAAVAEQQRQAAEYRQSRTLVPDDSRLMQKPAPEPVPKPVESSTVTAPDDSFMYAPKQHPEPGASKLGHPVSLADQVDQVYQPALGRGAQLPVGGSMFGKTWADVPRDGGSPESRMWGGPRQGGRHAGVDIPGRPGDPIYATGGGTVLRVGEGQGYGKMVDVRFPDGTVHRFGHLSSINDSLKPGMQIRPGETVGALGYSGNAGKEFPHLHLEVFKDEKSYMAAQGKSSRASWNLRMDPVAYYNRGDMPQSDQPVKLASAVDQTFMDAVKQIESGGNPRNVTGSYKGLYQLSESDFRKYGGKGSIFDPVQNEQAAANKFSDIAGRVEKSIGRSPDGAELYLAHQQGVTGLTTHLKNPDEPAWKNMAAASQRSDAWAKKAIWGNLTPEAQRQFGSVEKITSRQFVEFWRSRLSSIVEARNR